MAVANDSTQFLAAVRRDAFLAAADDTGNWTSPRILSVADDCTIAYCAPALKRAKQGWFQDDINIAMVSGQVSYDVPEEAMWNGIEAAWLIKTSTGEYYQKLDVVASSNRMMYQAYNTSTGSIPTCLYFENSEMVLVPAPSSATASTYTLVVSYYRRPAQLCLVADACSVSAIVNPTTQVLTLTTPSTTFLSSALDAYPGTSGQYRVDVYSRYLPNTRKLWNKAAGITGTASTFNPLLSTTDFAKISQGDVVTAKGTSPFPDLPPDAVPFLRKMVQKAILTAQTDTEALQQYLQQQSFELETFMKGMSNRSDGSPRKLSLYNSAARSFVRTGTNYRR